MIIQIHIYKNTTIYHGFFKQTLSGFVILLSQVSLGRKKIKTHPNHMCGFPFFAAAHGKNLKHFLKLIYCIVQYIIYTYLRTPSFKCDIHICFYLIHSSVVDMFLVPFPKEIKAIGSQYVTFFGSPNLLNIQGNLNWIRKRIRALKGTMFCEREQMHLRFNICFLCSTNWMADKLPVYPH